MEILVLLVVVVAVAIGVATVKKKSILKTIYLEEFVSYDEFVKALKNSSTMKTKKHKKRVRVVGD